MSATPTIDDGLRDSAGPAAPPGEEARATRRRRALAWIGLTAAIFLVILLRSPSVLFLPALEAEDGTFNFAHFYVHRGAAELLRFKAGYVPLVPNLIGYFSVRLPTRAIPYGFAWIPLILTLVTHTWLFRDRYREWLGPDSTRAVICLLFALAPLAQGVLLANTDYAIWNAHVLLFLLALAPLPMRPVPKFATWAATNVLVWSHPLAIFVSPFTLYRFARDRRDRWLHALTLVNYVAYQLAGVEGGKVLAKLDVTTLATAVGWTLAVAAQTAFRTAFGPTAYTLAAEHPWLTFAPFAGVVLTAAGVAARRSPRLRVVFPVLAYIVVAATLGSVLVRGVPVVVPLNGAPRFVYVSSLVFLVIFVLLLEHFVVRQPPSGETGSDSAPAPSPTSRRRAVVLAGVVTYYLVMNAQLGHFFVANGPAVRPETGPRSPYVQNDAGNGLLVREFFAELDRLEREKGSRHGIRLTLKKKADWMIVIDTTKEGAGT